MSSEHGRVLAVNRVRLGSELIGAHAVAATTLVIEDGSDFDENGGTLRSGDQTVTYLSAVHNDDDTATLTLSAGLSAAADDGDPVLLWDASRNVQASEVYAEVEVDGEAGGDPIQAIVAHHLIRELPEGIRSLVGESVRISEDGDDWIVVDVLGVSEAAGMKAEAHDAYTLTSGDVTAGTATIPLSHAPVDESVKLTFGTVAQEPTNYTVDYDAATITFPLDGWEPAGLRFSVHYWYVRGPVTGVIVPFQSPGWRYLQVAKTDATDRSGVSFDDSAWTVGAAPFEGGDVNPTWPAGQTAWAPDTSMWTRRTVAAQAGRPVRVAVRSEVARIYWNGMQVGSFGNPAVDEPGIEYEVTVTGADVSASNVLAVRYIDDTTAGSSCYGDTEVRYS